MNYKTYTMEEALEAIIDYRGKTPAKSENGIPTLSAKSVKNNHIDYSECYYISPDEYKRFMVRGFPQVGDVLLTTEAPMGVVAKLDRDDVAIAQRLLTLRGKSDILDNEYLLYLLQSPEGQALLKARETGTTVTGIKQSEFRKIQIRIPEIAEQRKIASVLSAIDEKIAVNTKVNDNLLQQVIALFNNAYESATSEAPFTSIVQVLSGGTPKTDNETFWNGAIPFFTPKDVGTPYTLTTEKYITGEGLAHCNSRLYPTNTTFVTARGTVGKVSLAGCPMAMNQSCYALGGIRIHPLLVYCYTLQVIDALKHKATGAVFDAITVRDFNAESIKRIDCECESQLLSMIEPMFSSILTNSMENQRLMTLRNTLLPKIMSGEIDVSAVSLGS